jgi:hypothetical protein
MHHAGDVLRHCAANRPSLYRSGSGCWCVVDISEPEAQQAVTAMEFMPVTDPLPGAPQQPQQRLVPPRAGLAHQPLRQRRVDRPGQSPLASKTQLASRAPTGRVPARAAMRPHPAAACRHRVHLPPPPARPGPGVALDEEGEERRQHAQPVVDVCVAGGTGADGPPRSSGVPGRSGSPGSSGHTPSGSRATNSHASPGAFRSYVGDLQAAVDRQLDAPIGAQAREAEDAFVWVTHYERAFWDMAMSG